MIILGIETSCDETAVALLEKKDNHINILANTVASSLALHAKTGGIIPEIAAREQIKYILPVISQTLQAGLGYTFEKNSIPAIDAIALTHGPGLIGSLLVGVETAKTLSLLWDKPLLPVNHMYGHLYANWIDQDTIQFPAIVLIVSGGHTDLLSMKDHTDITVIGSTRDDAAGEAFDKIGRLLNLEYPAGPLIAQLALQGDANAFHLPRPMVGSKDLDFSFSGLKTAVLTLVKKNNWDFTNESFTQSHQQLLFDLCASVQQAIIDVLIKKTIAASVHYTVSSVLLGGGVAANEQLQIQLRNAMTNSLPNAKLYVPQKSLCTDNGAMIAAAAFFATTPKKFSEVDALPELGY